MERKPRTFGEVAKSLAGSPLGIIALFIVLIYSLAALVTAFGSSFDAGERAPLIWFLVLFPALVLGVFAWLVSRHSPRLFGPGDFRNEDNFVIMQMNAVASLVAATAKDHNSVTELELSRVVESVLAARPARGQANDGWRNHVLWVDDRPRNSLYERRAFEAIGLRFTLAQSTDEAFQWFEKDRFAAVISDMGRREGPREGFALLDRLRKSGDNTPLFFSTAKAAEHKRESEEHGAQGCTSSSQELFEMVTRAVVN